MKYSDIYFLSNPAPILCLSRILEQDIKKEGITNVVYFPTIMPSFLYINSLYTFLEAIVIVNVTQVYFIGVAY